MSFPAQSSKQYFTGILRMCLNNCIFVAIYILIKALSEFIAITFRFKIHETLRIF